MNDMLSTTTYEIAQQQRQSIREQVAAEHRARAAASDTGIAAGERAGA